MAHAAAYVPIALSFLLLLIWLICRSASPLIDRAAAEEKGFQLLQSWLSPEQSKQWNTLSEFKVVGSQTGTRYRIRRGKVMNVHELDRSGNIAAHWCFAPKGDLAMGDILLAQKIALETMERDAPRKLTKIRFTGAAPDPAEWSACPSLAIGYRCIAC
jgi:hypothetical protein